MASNRSIAPDPSLVNRSPLAELLAVAAPTVATMVSYPLMQFIDARMVAELGPEALAAQGNGGIAAFVPIATVMGALSVINTYVAQHYGAGSAQRGPAYAWNGVWLGVICWVGLLLALPAIGPLFGALAHSEELTRLETMYARILIAGAIFPMAARALAQFFFGMHRPMVVLYATLIGNAVNIVMNYALIFGKLGMPELGLLGAGLGTVIGGVVEFGLLLMVFLSARYHTEFGTRAAWRFSRRCLRDIMRIGWPGALQFGNEMACWGIFMVALVGYFGEADNAAGWIALRYMQLSFMPAVGLSIAVTAVVGRYIGRGEHDVAASRAWLGVRVGMAYMGFCALLMVVFREPMLRFFISADYTPEQTQAVLDVGARIMICAALFQLFDALGIVLMGALRGAGDTVWPGVVTMILSWTVIIGGGLLFIRLAPGLGGLGPWIAAAVYIVLLGVAMSWRFTSGRWRRIALLDRPAAGAAGPAPILEPAPARIPDDTGPTPP